MLILRASCLATHPTHFLKLPQALSIFLFKTSKVRAHFRRPVDRHVRKLLHLQRTRFLMGRWKQHATVLQFRFAQGKLCPSHHLNTFWRGWLLPRYCDTIAACDNILFYSSPVFSSSIFSTSKFILCIFFRQDPESNIQSKISKYPSR